MKSSENIRRKYIILAVLFAISVVSVFVCTGIGQMDFSFVEIIGALFRDDGSTAGIIVWNLRLPRVLCCGLVGICLSLSGCILQGVMGNKLASPSTIGVTSGAAFVGYLILAAFPAYTDFLPIGAIVGAFGTSMLIYLLAYQKGVSSAKIILSGMAVSAVFGALNDSIRTFFADSIGNVSGFLVGGFNGCTWDTFKMLLPYALVGVGATLFLPYKMNILMLGDESAASLGLRTESFRFILICVSSLLAGSAVAAVGLVSFVGLIVPHIARLVIGADYRFLFPASAMLGFSLVAICDTVGRIIMPPGEIPVSIILSLIGAPFFLWLIRTREERSDG